MIKRSNYNSKFQASTSRLRLRPWSPPTPQSRLVLCGTLHQRPQSLVFRLWRPQPTSTNAQSPDCLSVVPSAHVSCALSPRQSTPSHQVVCLGCPPPTSANAHSPWWYVCGALSLLQLTPTVTSRSSMTPSAQQAPITYLASNNAHRLLSPSSATLRLGQPTVSGNVSGVR